MSDQEALELLRLLAKYVTEYPESSASAMSVADVAEDLAMSMDVTTTEADELRCTIEGARV